MLRRKSLIVMQMFPVGRVAKLARVPKVVETHEVIHIISSCCTLLCTLLPLRWPNLLFLLVHCQYSLQCSVNKI